MDSIFTTLAKENNYQPDIFIPCFNNSTRSTSCLSSKDLNLEHYNDNSYDIFGQSQQFLFREESKFPYEFNDGVSHCQDENFLIQEAQQESYENIIIKDQQYFGEEQNNEQPQNDVIKIEEQQPKEKSQKKLNKINQFSCEETHNFFVLNGPFLSKILGRWKYSKKIQCLSLPDKNKKSLGFINKLLQEVEQFEDGVLLKSFRQQIERVFKYDFVKYSQNKKNQNAQYINLKYQEAFKFILTNDSNTFTSIKSANDKLNTMLKQRCHI